MSYSQKKTKANSPVGNFSELFYRNSANDKTSNSNVIEKIFTLRKKQCLIPSSLFDTVLSSKSKSNAKTKEELNEQSQSFSGKQQKSATKDLRDSAFSLNIKEEQEPIQIEKMLSKIIENQNFIKREISVIQGKIAEHDNELQIYIKKKSIAKDEELFQGKSNLNQNLLLAKLREVKIETLKNINFIEKNFKCCLSNVEKSMKEIKSILLKQKHTKDLENYYIKEINDSLEVVLSTLEDKINENSEDIKEIISFERQEILKRIKEKLEKISDRDVMEREGFNEIRSHPIKEKEDLIPKQTMKVGESEGEKTLNTLNPSSPRKNTNHYQTGKKNDTFTCAKNSNVGAKSIPLFLEKKSENIKLQIGIDVGTSYTKVAFSYMKNKKNIMPLQIGKAIFFPSVMAINNEDKTLLFGDSATKFLYDKPWDSGIRYFKVLLAGKYDNNFKDVNLEEKFRKYISSSCYPKWQNQIECLTALYYAKIIDLVNKKLKEQYDDLSIDATFNFGIPADMFHKNEVQDRFSKVIHGAYHFVHKYEDINWKDSSKIYTDMSDILSNLSTNYPSALKRVRLVNEAQAQSAHYRESQEATDGLHVIVDLGAGTTDMSFCVLTGTMESEIKPFWRGAHIPYGMSKIENKISEHLMKKKGRPPTQFELSKIIENLSNKPDEDLAKILDLEFNNIWAQTVEVWKKFRGSYPSKYLWGATEDLNVSPEKDTPKYFIAGGGAAFINIKKALSKSWCFPKTRSYDVRNIPGPDNWGKDCNVRYERMSVACGLCIPEISFEESQMLSSVKKLKEEERMLGLYYG